MADDFCELLVEGLIGEDEDGEGVRHTKSHLRKKNATVCANTCGQVQEPKISWAEISKWRHIVGLGTFLLLQVCNATSPLYCKSAESDADSFTSEVPVCAVP